MQDEFDAIIDNKEFVHLPSNTNVIRSLWIFKQKTKFDGYF